LRAGTSRPIAPSKLEVVSEYPNFISMTKPALIFLLLVAAAPRVSFGQDTTFATCPCTLKGRVVNSVTGAPVRNALVESGAGSPNSTLTDSDGDFHFDGLPAGSATLSAIKPGFLPSAPSTVLPTLFSIAPDAPPAIIKLVPGGVVRGHIADDQGVPLENFSVQLMRRVPGTGEPTRQFFETIVTNDLGNFRIPDLPAGSYFLLVAPQDTRPYRSPGNEIPSGYPRVYYPGVLDLSAATPIKVSAGRESIADLTLTPKPFVRLSGKVSGYSPGSSVEVEVAVGPSPEFLGSSSVTFDRRTGAFQTDWIPPGNYAVGAAMQEGDSSNSSRGPLMGLLSVSAMSSVSGLNLVLTPTVNIGVNVEGLAAKEDLTRLVVQLSNEYGTTQVAQSLPSNGDSKLPISDLYFLAVQQRTYHLDVSSTADEPYYVESAKSGSTDLLTSDLVVDSSASARPIEIVLRRGAATLSGTVNLKDATRGAVVCLLPEKSNVKPLFQPAAANGSFQFENLPPGDYRIAAVDSLVDVDLSNPASLKKISSAASEISLAPSQSLTLSLDLTAVEE